jgi:hypothetical protein
LETEGFCKSELSHKDIRVPNIAKQQLKKMPKCQNLKM